MSIGAGANDVAGKIRQVQASFGAGSSHIVGHSKGGLWGARAVENMAWDGDIAFPSMTTISTPHRGSPLADLLVGASQHRFATLRSRFVFWVIRHFDPSGAEDMTSTFNRQMQNPDSTVVFDIDGTPIDIPVRYFALGSDADGNLDGHIDGVSQEGQEGYPIIGGYWGLGRWIGDRIYRFLFSTWRVHFDLNERGLATPRFIEAPGQLNDMAVPVASAWRLPDQGAEGAAYTLMPYSIDNHRHQFNEVTAAAVFSRIKDAEPVQ